jgi:hypothetical protein
LILAFPLQQTSRRPTLAGLTEAFHVVIALHPCETGFVAERAALAMFTCGIECVKP